MFNWILGGSGFEPGEDHLGVRRTLRMGDQSHIISFHFLECGGGLLMSDRSWITGRPFTEEIRITKRRDVERSSQAVTLRREEAVIERVSAAGGDDSLEAD